MKRDWDIIKSLLSEIEGLSDAERRKKRYGYRLEDEENDDKARAKHVEMLYKASYVEGVDFTAGEYVFEIMHPNLTWEAHDLLDTMRSNKLWDKVKSLALDKGVELTVDVIKALAKLALPLI